MASSSPFANISTEALNARAWPFEQARNLLARLLKSRLNDDAERDLASTLIHAGLQTPEMRIEIEVTARIPPPRSEPPTE